MHQYKLTVATGIWLVHVNIMLDITWHCVDACIIQCNETLR